MYFVLLAACTSSTFVAEHGGSMRVHVEPVSGNGITVDITRDGLSDAELDEIPRRGDWLGWDCPGPYLHYATDTATGDRVASNLAFCARDVPMTGACDTPVNMTFELDGFLGSYFFSMDPVDNAEPGDQFSVGDSADLGSRLFESQGVFTTTVAIDDGCLEGQGAEHQISVEWDFPQHAERKNKTNEDFSVPNGF